MQLILSNNISAYFFLWESLWVDQLLILTKRTHVHSVGKIGRHRDCLGAPGLHARATHCRRHAHKHFLFISTSSSANIDTQRDLRVRSERRFHATLTYRTPRACAYLPDTRLRKETLQLFTHARVTFPARPLGHRPDPLLL